jgi:uncharacterized protein (DUF488 family)
VEIFTIGFAGKPAPEFFGILRTAGIRRLIDIRLNNSSQLAGFTKSDSLPFFLKEILGADYHHEPLLCPTKEILSGYQDKKIGWEEFESRFLELLRNREVADKLDRSLFAVPAVLLCSEPTADKCHRRLVAEHLASAWGGVTITHL